MRNRVALLLTLLICVASLQATKDQPCRSGEFQLVAEPVKGAFAKGERVTIRLTFKNLTSRDVYIVPYLFPFDYWIGKHSNGRWKALATGIVGPNAKERRGNSLAPTQPSEYRKVPAGESYTTHFDIELGEITKAAVGRFRLDAVRVHVYDRDSGPKESGCAVFGATSTPFTVQ